MKHERIPKGFTPSFTPRSPRGENYLTFRRTKGFCPYTGDNFTPCGRSSPLWRNSSFLGEKVHPYRGKSSSLEEIVHPKGEKFTLREKC
jgi:hypothetical protein